MENPPFSLDSHSNEEGCSFSRLIISPHKCTKGRTMWGVWAVCVGLGQKHAGVLPASAYTPVRIADSCFQRHRAPGPPRVFTAQRENFSQKTHIGLQICAWWHPACHWRLRAADQTKERSPLPCLYPGITETLKNPSLEWRTERKYSLHLLWDPVQITDDHQGDCTFQHAAEREEWTKHNNARGPFDELSCSSHYKNSSLSVLRYDPEFSYTQFRKKKIKKNKNPTTQTLGS